MVVDFPIYFSDLTEDAQKRLLEFVEVPKEAMAWDEDKIPVAMVSHDKDFNPDNYKNLKPYKGG